MYVASLVADVFLTYNNLAFLQEETKFKERLPLLQGATVA